MSAINTTPVLLCKRCRRPLVLTQLSTAAPDPEGVLLHQLMQSIGQNAICKDCRNQLNYYASQGRGEDWQKGDA